MADASSGPEAARRSLAFGTVVVVGGGCYGSYYVRQLQRATAAGAVHIDELLVVDRNSDCAVAQAARDGGPAALVPRVVTAEWAAFTAEWLGRAAEHPSKAARDAIVPSPLMPHLLYEWLLGRLRARLPARAVRTLPLGAELPVPWQRTGDDGTQYASFATWMCPINCIEPARCPHTRGARDWTMPAALRQFVASEEAAGRPTAGPYVFHCTHRAYGVGMIDVGDVLRAEADLLARADSQALNAIVGTVSHCHGAVGRITVAAP